LYRDVEKMLEDSGDNKPDWAKNLEAKAVPASFDPLTLRRPLLLFHKALGLKVGHAGVPNPEFLVHLLEGSGHQEQLRKTAGAQFKNLENFLRGAHAPTATTWNLLLQVLRIDDATLRALAHGRKDGPLVPLYIELFELLETTFIRSFRTMTVGKVYCRCCSADMLDDARIWWKEQDLCVPADAAIFIDRLLTALLGGVLLLEGLGRWLSWGYLSADEVIKLTAPCHHPIGHWMAIVRRHRGLQHDWQLTVISDSESPGPVIDGRLRKWRSGQGLLPMDKALLMIEPVKDKTSLKHALFAARTISLAIDVVQATADTQVRPGRTTAQGIVHARLQELHLHFQIALAAARTTATAEATLLVPMSQP
jgi:hypothetical protein